MDPLPWSGIPPTTIYLLPTLGLNTSIIPLEYFVVLLILLDLRNFLQRAFLSMSIVLYYFVIFGILFDL